MTGDVHARLYASPLSRWLVILSVMVPSAVYVLDLTVVTVALPHMQGSFSATQDQISWVVTSYIVGGTIVTGCAGWASMRFGRKQVFAASCVMFTLTSIMCGLATSLESEVFWRATQGFFGAPILPLSQAIMFDLYPKERHGTANSIWGMGILLGPVMGPIVGGFMTENYGWPWAFYINVPAMILPTIGVLMFVPRTARQAEKTLDWFGFLSLCVGMGALQFMLNRGQRLDWFASPEIVFEAAIAAIALYFFVVHTITGKRPFVPPQLFANRNFVIGVCFVALFAFILQSPIVLLSLFFQNLGGYPVMTVGLLLTPRGLGAFVSMFLGGILVARMDPRALMCVGFFCFGLSGWLIAGWTTEVAATEVAWTGILQGLGSGFVWVPLGMLTVATLAPAERDEALAFLHMMFNVGASLGIVLMINLALRTTVGSHANLTEYVTRFNDLFRATPPAWNLASPHGLAALNLEIDKQSGIIGYNACFYAIALISAIALPLSYLLSRGARGAKVLHAG